MTSYLPYCPQQQMLLPQALQEWLPEGHLAYFISEAVDGLDLSAFHARYAGGGPRNQPFHPAMMVKVLLYAYATGVFSSRKIARKLHEDVAFRVLAAGNFPAHRTLSDFRAFHQKELSELFVQVVRLAREMGLGPVLVDARQLLAERLDDRVDALARLGVRQGQAVTFSHQHGDELAPATDQRGQGLLLGAGQRLDEALALRMTFDDLAQLRQDVRIDAVGLGQLPHGTGEVARLPGVDDRHGMAGRLQGAGHGRLQPTCGFHDHQADWPCAQMAGQRLDALGVIGQAQRGLFQSQGHLQRVLGDVDAHRNGRRSRIWQACHRPSLQMRSEFIQLSGLPTSGSTHAPRASVRAGRPQGKTGCASFAKPARLWICGQFACGEPGRLPWKTRCVSHRAPLCPQAPQLPTLPIKTSETKDTRADATSATSACPRTARRRTSPIRTAAS